MKQVATLLLLAGVLIAGCATEHEHTTTVKTASPNAVLVEGSGTYSRPISTASPLTQQFFDQGLRFAWGFYFPESIASYQEAARHDPTHPMPYWGMAHAMGPNPNSRYSRMRDDPKGEGGKAINIALENIERASPLERELILALNVLYDKAAIADDGERDRAYLARMRALNAAHPNDPDVAALYAAAYMSIGRWDYWDSEGKAKDETIPVANALEHVIDQGIHHPGVFHLHIHLIEASLEPERALASADALEATVPIGGHVVHMPAHIYVRVGDFQRAIDNNVRSQQVDKTLAKIWGDMPLPNLGTYPLSHRMHAAHAIDFIRYAATVQGNYKVAVEAALASKAMIGTHAHDMPGAQKRIAAPWMVDKIFGRWDRLIGQEPSHEHRPYLDAMWAYAQGSAHVATGNLDAANEQLVVLRQIAESPDADQYRVGATPASAVIKLASLGLSGELMQATGDLDGAISAFREGVALEDLNNYTEPPDWGQPMRHYLGAALLQAGQAEEAEAVYRRDLRWNQNNGWSLLGLSQALHAQGKLEEASRIRAAFDAAWRYADTPITRSRL